MFTSPLGIITIPMLQALLLYPPLQELLPIGVYSRRANREVPRPLCVEKEPSGSIIYYMKAAVIGHTHIIRLLQVLIENRLI